MLQYRAKSLTLDNWQECDPTYAAFSCLPQEVDFHPVTADDWLAEILAPQLGPNVPPQVQRLYEVARGALAYGYYYYPLYLLGIEQVSRVAEAAIDQKCLALVVPSEKNTFDKRIDWLIGRNTLNTTLGAEWHDIRGRRNDASRLGQHHILPPCTAIDLLWRITERINALFP